MKNKKDHMCLLVRGQRQVGKTYIIDMFGRNEYRHYFYANLSMDEDARTAFDGNLDIDTIVGNLSIMMKTEEIILGAPDIPHVCRRIADCFWMRRMLRRPRTYRKSMDPSRYFSKWQTHEQNRHHGLPNTLPSDPGSLRIGQTQIIKGAND